MAQEQQERPRILSVVPRSVVDRQIGGMVPVLQVRFRTAKGVEDVLRVARGTSDEEIREQVRDAAARLDRLIGEV